MPSQNASAVFSHSTAIGTVLNVHIIPRCAPFTFTGLCFCRGSLMRASSAERFSGDRHSLHRAGFMWAPDRASPHIQEYTALPSKTPRTCDAALKFLAMASFLLSWTLCKHSE